MGHPPAEGNPADVTCFARHRFGPHDDRDWIEKRTVAVLKGWAMFRLAHIANERAPPPALLKETAPAWGQAEAVSWGLLCRGATQHEADVGSQSATANKFRVTSGQRETAPSR